MNRDYDDIRSRLGEPLWWDDNCVPRYEPFHPDMCGVYDRWVLYMEIACQSCGQRFNVAQAANMMWRVQKECAGESFESAEFMLDALLHWGDPPRHGCVGDTMLSDHGRPVELWHYGKDFEWHQVPITTELLASIKGCDG